MLIILAYKSSSSNPNVSKMSIFEISIYSPYLERRQEHWDRHKTVFWLVPSKHDCTNKYLKKYLRSGLKVILNDLFNCCPNTCKRIICNKQRSKLHVLYLINLPFWERCISHIVRPVCSLVIFTNRAKVRFSDEMVCEQGISGSAKCIFRAIWLFADKVSVIELNWQWSFPFANIKQTTMYGKIIVRPK